MAKQDVQDAYAIRWAPAAFEAVFSIVFAPFGGGGRMRRQAIDLLGIERGARVLEPGCGAGAMTALLSARGAKVLAYDRSAAMVAGARRRCPSADFDIGVLDTYRPDGVFDLVLFAFVLHELEPPARLAALAIAREALAPSGRVAILDHAVPRSGVLARWWRGVLMRLEPPSVADCIDRGYEEDLRQAGLVSRTRHDLAGGAAALTIADRA